MRRNALLVHVAKLTSFGAGGIAIVLGLLVLVGWHTHRLTLVQLGPAVGPMSYSAALSLTISGIGLLALIYGWGRLAAVAGTIVAVIGGLTLGEYLLGISLGIGSLFMQLSLTSQGLSPWPMAPNSALAFALAGVTMLAMSLASRRDLIFLLAGPLGAVVVALGLVALIGYLTGLKTYGWGYHTEMSPQTALGCVVLGSGIIVFSWQVGVTALATTQYRLPVLIGIGVLTVTLCLWQALIASEEALVGRTVDLSVANVHNEIMTQMQSRILALIRMGKRWEVQGRPPREVWEADAHLFVRHHPGVQAVAWIDPTLDVQWIVPRDSNEAIEGLNLGFEDRRRSALELSRDSRQVTSTRVLDLMQGGRGFQVYIPIVSEAGFEGFMAGIFRVRDLFDAILANVALRYSIAVYEGGEEIYGRYPANRQHERQWSQATAIGLYGVTWNVRIWPTPLLLAESLSSLPEVILVVGLLTSALLVLTVYLASIAQRRASEVVSANQALQHEISDHKRTEALLAARISQMEAVRTVTMEITRELDLTTLLRLITQRAMDLVEAGQSGAVYLWDEPTQVLVPRAWHGRGAWMQQVRIHLGEGLVGTVARRRQGLLVNDYQRSPYAQARIVEYFGSTAIIAEPLVYRDRLVGVIVLDNRGSSQLFAQEDRELLTFFAAQAAIAIENARLYEALERRFTRLQTLTRLNQLVSSSLDTSRVLREIARAAGTLMDAPVVSFWLVDESTQTLEVQAFSDERIGADFPHPRLSFAQDGVGWVATHRRPLNLPDVFADHRFMALDWWRSHNLRSFFGLPILHEDTLMAVLSLNGQTPFRFDTDDQSLLDSFVAQAAVAIRNARFFAEIRDRTANLASLNTELQTEIGERQRAEGALQRQTGLVQLLQSAAVAANEARSIEDAMQTVVEQICTYTGWPVGHVYIVDAEVPNTLLPTTIWHLPDPLRFASFRRVTDATTFVSGQGLPGRVLVSRQPTWISDVTTDPNFPRAAMARDSGVRTGFGFPVLVGTEVVAVLEFFSDAIVGPDEALLAVMAHIGTQLGRVVERQRAEEALRASEERFRSVVQSANDAIVLADNQGRIMAWNHGAQTIFGYTEVEVLGRSLTTLMPARYHAAHQEGIERVQHSGERRFIGRTVEVHGLRRDGSEFPLEMSLATWQAGGSMFFSGIMRDITERKQALDQLQRQREALFQREKLAALGSLLASVAHELNNPLSIVMMQADLLTLEFKDEAFGERIKPISESAERCVHIVRNFLALARQNPPQRMSVALNTIVEEALGLLTYALRVDDIEVELRLATDLPPLSADPHQLHQVVVNLLTNAHQALRNSSPPRRLTVTTRHDPTRQRLYLEVADSGPGIPEALQDRIFEPFFTTKPPGVGTGLGLPFCKGIIEEHGGSIHVVSEPGRGAIFRVELRVEAVPPARLSAAVPKAESTVAGKTILVVDDEPGITSALAYLLRRDGHTVDTAANGRLALEKLQERPYDLILCDLRMPELDGPGLYRALEERYPHMLGRIIFLTGDTLSTEAREFLEKVGMARLSKPFRAAEVRQAIQQAMHGR